MNLWIREREDERGITMFKYKCSNCNESVYMTYKSTERRIRGNYKYCPYCGTQLEFNDVDA